MNRSNIYRLALLGITAAVLAACGTKKSPSITKQPPRTVPPVATPGEPMPTGTPSPQGYTHTPGGGSVYTVVPHAALPQWNEQNFAESLRSFRLGCSKLQAQSDWRNVCMQAAQTPYQNAAAKAFFEQYFTP